MAASKPAYAIPEYASRFKEPGMARAYLFRAPYPSETFQILSTLMPGTPRNVLDVGCGTGEIARNLVDFADSVDAIDFSDSMIELGRNLPAGNHRNLHWIAGKVEESDLHPPYALITEGESLHWMDWDIVFPLFQKILTPNGHLALVERKDDEVPWKDQLLKIMNEYSTDPKYEPFDMAVDLERSGLFQMEGERKTLPITFVQSVDDYVESFHSWSEFSRIAMGKSASRFDEDVKALVSNFATGKPVERRVSSLIVWGRPRP